MFPEEAEGAADRERITGPLHGWFIAAYALPAGDDGFLGYAKICREPPEDVWTCNAIRKIPGDLHETAEMALLNAEYHARHLIDVLEELRRASVAVADWRLIRQAAQRRMSEDLSDPQGSRS